MKKLILSVLLFAACGGEVLDPIDRTLPELPDDPVEQPIPNNAILIHRNGAPDWALEQVQEAADIWTSHNFPFALTNLDSATIAVQTIDVQGGIGGVFTVGDVSEIYVLRGEGVDGVFNQSCILASELGLIVGMEAHAEPGGLMSLQLPFVPPDTECPWTTEDQTTLCNFAPDACQ